MIAVGQKLPNATLYEFFDEERDGCSLGPNAFEVEKLTAGKKLSFLPCLAHLHQPAQPNMFQDLWSILMRLKPKVLMRFGVFL